MTPPADRSSPALIPPLESLDGVPMVTNHLQMAMVAVVKDNWIKRGKTEGMSEREVASERRYRRIQAVDCLG